MREGALRVGDQVRCRYAGSTWYEGQIVAIYYSAPLFYSEQAADAGYGHDGQGEGRNSTTGHWWLHESEKGRTWRPGKQSKNGGKNSVG